MVAMGDPASCASFDDTDRLVLRYAETLTRDNRVDDALYAELAAHFPPDALLELCATIGLSALVNRMHATFRTDVDEATVGAVSDAPVCLLPMRAATGS